MFVRTCFLRRSIALHARHSPQPTQFYGVTRGMATLDYSTWNAEQLLARVQNLEKDLKEANEKYHSLLTSQAAGTSVKISRQQENGKYLDPSKYTTRLIALKFAYLGRNYNGLEYTANRTVQPTIEEVLWEALRKARLIFPSDEEAIAAGQISWTGCDYTKCGRTDKGVSAFGQVIGLRVRSNRPPPPSKESQKTTEVVDDFNSDKDVSLEHGNDADAAEAVYDPVRDEIPYVHLLNKLLPADVRVLAWCSDLPQDFSARFSCRERRYRYFFTNPAFVPAAGSVDSATSKTVNTAGENSCREGWLDIAAMQDAAKRYEGLHDFRNLCKVDASKQIIDFRRRIFRSEIRELDPSQEPATFVTAQAFAESGTQANGHATACSKVAAGPKVFEFVLHGSAFLWHQVRHMVAILFLVGQGLETPTIVDRLLDVQNCPQKPHYAMADDAPLVLWDCIFPDLDSESRDDSLKWIYANEEIGRSGKAGKSKPRFSGVTESLWKTWRKHKIDEVLAGSLLNLAVSQGNPERPLALRKDGGPHLFLGGDSSVYKGAYVPLMQRERGEHFETMNARYAAKKGLIPKGENDLLQLRNSRRDKRHDHLEDSTD